MSKDRERKSSVLPLSGSNSERLAEMTNAADLGGGQSRIDDQHRKGKKTARERIDLLLDQGSFVEIDKFVLPRNQEGFSEVKHYGDGVVTGHGTIEGRRFSYLLTTSPSMEEASEKCSGRRSRRSWISP